MAQNRERIYIVAFRDSEDFNKFHWPLSVPLTATVKDIIDFDKKQDEKYYYTEGKYKGDIYLYDSERDSFMMALKALGYSMNTESEEELQQADKRDFTAAFRPIGSEIFAVKDDVNSIAVLHNGKYYLYIRNDD